MASWSGGKWGYPVPPTVSRSVKTEYGAPNTLAVELRDRSIVAYVNGRPVATAELPTEASGTLGLYVDQRGMEVLFSHLRVVEPAADALTASGLRRARAPSSMCSGAGLRVPASTSRMSPTTALDTGVGTPTSRPLSTTWPFM